MTKVMTEYEKDKQDRKQKMVRNEFLYYGNSSGRYEFPIIKKQDINVDEIKFLSFVDAKKDDKENKDKTIHFFTYDWLFEKVYEKPEVELEKLKQYKYLLSPDFSIFTNMPLALQIESIFKNRWCGAYWQSQGLKVIPTVSWGDEKSFHFCFDGIEEGSVVAVCTYYRENCEEEFMLGYNEMMKRIKPSKVICYDEPFKSMTGDVVEFLPTTYEWTKNLSWQDKLQFKWEKHHRNVIGLNKKDFKFFDYDDPYVKDQIVKCDVCGSVALTDQYGNGDCEKCGWAIDVDCRKNPDRVQYPNIVSLNKAKRLYKEGKPMIPSFDDFIAGLVMYSEMEFDYCGNHYGVDFYREKTKPTDFSINAKGDVEFYQNEVDEIQKFPSTQEFKNKASIDGKLLKDIWQDVQNARYMVCE